MFNQIANFYFIFIIQHPIVRLLVDSKYVGSPQIQALRPIWYRSPQYISILKCFLSVYRYYRSVVKYKIKLDSFIKTYKPSKQKITAIF